MSAAPDADALFIELASLTNLSRGEWEDVLSLPPDLQALALANYRAMDWTRPGSSAFERVVSILMTLAGIAGAVGGIAGAAGAVAALRSL